MGSLVTDRRPEARPEREAIQEQLERLLAHPAFKSSKRCLNLLRYVVEHHLASEGEPLKERTLGAAVFGRDAGYDTNADPIVRTTAGEVRKRIAQYYHEAEHDAELRIDLPPGSYTPQFQPPAQRPAFDAAPLAALAPLPVLAPHRSARRLLFALVVTGAAAVGIAAAALWPHSAMDRFWGPVLDSSRPVLLSIGQPTGAQPQSVAQPAQDPAVLNIRDYIRSIDHVVLPDAIALSRVAGFLGKAGRDYLLQGALSSTLTDLRRGPTILIAGFDNPWTMRLVDPLRFHFVRFDGSAGIEDRNHPAQRGWFVECREPYSQLTQDFAIVARFRDATTGETIVVVAGIGENGTIAAGEFVTSPAFLEGLSKQLPAGWSRKNVEAVLATQVIDRKSGPPRILATHVW
ncbi:MAG: hypothetical protein LAP87_04880 [Acidobacteriia bacterium]|nr:hypothetical protein [Terriglobia bacterium]